MAEASGRSYGGDVAVETVWERLVADRGAVLADVRTQAEWTYVGWPDLTPIGKIVLLMEWQHFPDMAVDPDFVVRMDGALRQRGAVNYTAIYFICRSGHRSRHAAQAMTAAGYSACFNVAEGFEGPLDEKRHRGRKSGWKASGLPWEQR